MAFRFFENPRSRTVTALPPSAELSYTATGTTDSMYVLSHATLATPVIYNGLWRQDIRVDPVASDHFTVTVPYGPFDVTPGEFRLSFDTTGGTIHILASRETKQKVKRGGGAAPDFKGLIGVHQDQVDGVDVVIPALRLTVHFQHPLGVVSLARIKALARNTGKVNSDAWLSFKAGEVLFLGATGDEGNAAPTNVAYQFACMENASGLTIGNIAGINKNGHEYVWIYYKDGVDAGPPVRPIKTPEFAYVERVYEEVAFKSLLGFG